MTTHDQQKVGFSLWATFAQVRDTFRGEGFRGTFRRYGWKLFAAFFVYYLVRDVTLYILIPYLAAKGALAFFR